MRKIIEFKSARLGYGSKVVFNALNMEIFEGDCIGIVGPNGSGKTTLLRSIMGLLKSSSGEIIRDKNISFGYCMQRQFIDTIFPFTVFEITMMARARIIGPLRRPTEKDISIVRRALEMTGVLDLAQERFYNLSGGQKQRTLLARALALEPNFLVLDEPTADLDIKAEKEILALIVALGDKNNLTIAMVTHELNEVINNAEKFIFLNKHAPQNILRKDQLNSQLLSEIFDTPLRLEKIDGKLTVL
jgi:ABC-type Mn2+/Zn2+ transport system ATPase subunit